MQIQGCVVVFVCAWPHLPPSSPFPALTLAFHSQLCSQTLYNLHCFTFFSMNLLSVNWNSMILIDVLILVIPFVECFHYFKDWVISLLKVSPSGVWFPPPIRSLGSEEKKWHPHNCPLYQQFSMCGLYALGNPQGLHGGQSYFHNKTKVSSAFCTVLTFAVVVQKQW